MGEASRKKRERQKFLDSTGAIWPGNGLTIREREKLARYHAWVETLDIPPGNSIEFAPVPTWREILHNRRQIILEFEKELDTD